MKIEYPKNCRQMFTSNGKLIEIYDNVFTSSEKYSHIRYAQSAPYVLEHPTIGTPFWHRNDTFFFHGMGDSDFDKFGFVKTNFYKNIILKKYPSHQIEKSWIVCSSPLSSWYFHVDNDDETLNRKTLLYYLNSRWNRDWGGETLFANNNGECEIAVEYKPGRVVIFDGSIDHRASAVSMKSDEFRFVFVVQFINL